MLHLLVGGACNNNCIFCMEADRAGRAAHVRAQTAGDVRAMIDAAAVGDGVLFTSGEPTLAPQLIDYVRWAKARGIRRIGLISNGRRLAYADFVKRLVDGGLNNVTISIHGHDAALHDGLTRTPGSFRETCAGLDNLMAIKAQRRLEVRTSTVVTRRSLGHLADIHAFLRQRSIDLIVFNVMMAEGRGAEHLTMLMPRYSEIVDRFGLLCERLPAADLRRLRVEDVPPCIARQLPPAIRGELEPFSHFEAVGSTGLAGRTTPGGSTEQQPVLREDGRYYLTDRAAKDQARRVKGDPCERCSLGSRCAGVWRPYVEAFGWAELGDRPRDG